MDPNELPLPPTPPLGGPPPIPVVTNAMPAIPSNAQAQQPQQSSMLDRLRQQVMQDIMPNEAADMQRRARTFGAAMMGTPGSFFQGVAAGQQAIEQQRAAEQQARRQTLERESNAEYQRAQQRLAEAQQLYNQDPTNPRNQLYLAQAQQALAMAGYYQQGGRGSGERQPRWQLMQGAEGPVFVNLNDPTQRLPAEGLVMPRDPQMEAAARLRATDAANRRVQEAERNGTLRTNDPVGRQRLWQEAYDMALVGNRPSQNPATQQNESPSPTGGSPGPRQGPSQRFQYQPPQ